MGLLLLLGIGGAFYGGMKYTALRHVGDNGFPYGNRFENGQNVRNDDGFRGGMMNGNGRGGGMMGNGWQNQNDGQGGRVRGQAGNVLVGEVTGKDDKNISIKLPNGTLKVIPYTDTTTVEKTTEASLSDIETGKRLQVQVTQNADGTIAAQNVHIVNQ